MTDERLLDGGATDFEASLLKSAATEAPSPELSAKMMAPVAGATAGAVAGSSVVKWAAGLLGGVVLVGAVAYVAQPSGPQETSPAQPPVATPPIDEGPKRADAPQRQEETVAETTEEEREQATQPVKKPPASGGSTLAAEMKMLDQARSALKSRDSETALKILSSYAARYPRGSLREEATVLRVKALKESGAQDKASKLKNEFLKMHPQSAHKKQLEQKNDSPK